jgi:DNA-binding transcriptional LysR family regulator
MPNYIPDITMANPTAGELRIGCADSMLSGFLPVIINRLCSRHPRLIFHVTQAPAGPALYRELRERNVDLVLAKLAMPISDADLSPDILFDEPQLVVTGARSPWARRRSIRLAELVNERWTLPPSSGATGALIAEIFHACGLLVPHVSVHANSIQLYDAGCERAIPGDASCVGVVVRPQAPFHKGVAG